ncbi:insulinase family protein [Treponema sp.]|uniref:insulinase family protein n=1 Tax=Treponema sp. TaxID=166 RepID=UPI00298DBC87|nr:insulinase family protein [Treponema sp.]MCR5614400.1 insulinase family protein [Treponema sp.]
MKNTYKGFELIRETDIPDCSSKGIYLRHKKTGLEVFHLLNDDKENLCSFCFRTPPLCSNGVAHIMEHSVLCGSEKYPVKDPFIHLENQSLKTFLNAMTGCDKTMYPVSSVVEEDYFNLMSVYADSVFFPHLNKEVFLQEGRHLEKSSDGTYSIQGVVYNEMKGCYSSFDSVCGDLIQNSILPDSIYQLDSGGDPSVIPDLTYEQYLAFHKENYRPDNCLVFLYGNIPTEKQLDFLQKDLLDRIEQRLDLYPEQKVTPLERLKKSKARTFDKINCIESYAPSVLNPKKDEDPSVVVSWRLAENYDVEKYIEAGLVSEILTEHDGSPLTKALLDSGLGTELCGSAGFDSTTKYLYTSFGLNGVKRKNISKVYDLVISVIKKLADEGIRQDDIDCAIMDLEFTTKEVVRHNGPFSLVLLRRVLKGWIYGDAPESHLLIQAAFERVKAKIKNDSNYLQNLLKEYFLENNQCSIAVITPSPRYADLMRAKENEQIAHLKKELNDSELAEQTEALRKFQTMDETEALKCLPHINARTISYDIPQIKTDISLLHYDDSDKNKAVPLAVNIENTNGIDYFQLSFPFDTLTPEEYNFVSPLMYMLTEVGWGGKSWDECATIVNKYSGNFSCSTHTSSCSNTLRAKEIEKQFSDLNIIGRDWFTVNIKMLHESMTPCLDFFAECVSTPDFMDSKRIKLLFDEYMSDFENSISSSGHIYMAARSNYKMNRSKAVDELIGGITNLFFLRKYKKDTKKLCQALNSVAKKIFASGSVIHIVCDEKSRESAVKQIEQFAKKLKLCIPCVKPTEFDDNAFIQMASVSKKFDEFEVFQKNIQIGFAACSSGCSSYGTKEGVAESVYAHWLSTTLLWERIRTICGAYGANAGVDTVEQIFSVLTYRDPNPLETLKQVEECLRLGAEKSFTEDEVQKAITGRFSSELKPRTPKANGMMGYERLLYCISQDDVNDRINRILTITPQDMHEAAKRLYDNFNQSAFKAALVPKICKIAGKIAKVEL